MTTSRSNCSRSFPVVPGAFVVNRGHYFGSGQFNDQAGLSKDEQSFGKEPELSDDDKHALIAFLKTF